MFAVNVSLNEQCDDNLGSPLRTFVKLMQGGKATELNGCGPRVSEWHLRVVAAAVVVVVVVSVLASLFPGISNSFCRTLPVSSSSLTARCPSW